MSGCERALDLIGLRLDGPLSPEEQRELDAHLEQCPACRAAARELEELEGALVQLGECDPPPQLVSGVMERVRADSAPAKVVPLWKRPAFRGALGPGSGPVPDARPAGAAGGIFPGASAPGNTAPPSDAVQRLGRQPGPGAGSAAEPIGRDSGGADHGGVPVGGGGSGDARFL